MHKNYLWMLFFYLFAALIASNYSFPATETPTGLRTVAASSEQGVHKDYPDSISCLLFLPFDDSLQPFGSKRHVASAEVPETDGVEYLPGIKGSAVVMGEKKKVYHTGLNNLTRYALSFWIAPLDWKGSEEQAGVFLRLKGKNGEMVFGKHPGKHVCANSKEYHRANIKGTHLPCTLLYL